MTIDHRALGEKYGYPTCCIDQFVKETEVSPHSQQAKKRGLILLEGINKQYVPCDNCIGKEGYIKFEDSIYAKS